VLQNVDKEPQSEYYMPFEADVISRIGGFDVVDKQDASKGPFKAEIVEYDTERCATKCS